MAEMMPQLSMSVGEISIPILDATSTSIPGKNQTLLALKTEVMDKLNKEVKSLDEDKWMYEGPRSRINLYSKRSISISHHQSDARKE